MGPRMATNMLITMLISYTMVNIAVSQLCVVFLTCTFSGIVSKVNKLVPQVCLFSFIANFLKQHERICNCIASKDSYTTALRLQFLQ